MIKVINKVPVLVLSLALTGAVLTGCGESRQSRQETQTDNTQNTTQETQTDNAQNTKKVTQQDTAADEVQRITTEEDEPATAGYEDNFAVDSKAAKEFAERVKAAAADKDLESLAALTAFPVYVGLPDAGVVETREDFLKLGAEKVFTEELLKSVENADIEKFQPSMAGFSISDGGACNINFGVADGVLAVNGINY